MRVIDSIPHPQMKITVFRMENRVSVKFENEGYEQTFKFGDDERFNLPEAVRRWADDGVFDRVLEGFRHMHGTRLAADSRAFPSEAGSLEFEEII